MGPLEKLLKPSQDSLLELVAAREGGICHIVGKELDYSAFENLLRRLRGGRSGPIGLGRLQLRLEILLGIGVGRRPRQ